MNDTPPENEPYVLEARRKALSDRAHELSLTVHILAGFATELRTILDQRNIPEVQDLLERIVQKAYDTAELAEDLFTALDRHWGREQERE